jgi:hypothetical protein
MCGDGSDPVLLLGRKCDEELTPLTQGIAPDERQNLDDPAPILGHPLLLGLYRLIKDQTIKTRNFRRCHPKIGGNVSEESPSSELLVQEHCAYFNAQHCSPPPVIGINEPVDENVQAQRNEEKYGVFPLIFDIHEELRRASLGTETGLLALSQPNQQIPKRREVEHREREHQP